MSKRKRKHISTNIEESCKESEGVIKEKCDIILNWDLDTLEKFDKITGNELDDGENIIIKNGHIGLLLVERANGIFSSIRDIDFDTRDIFAEIMDKINYEQQIEYIGDYKFGIINETLSLDEKDLYQIINLKSKIKESNDFVCLIALELDNNMGGHYGVFFRLNGIYYFFDSMQDLSRNNNSYYTSTFFEIVYRSIDVDYKIIETNEYRDIEPKGIVNIIRTNKDLQITGGFVKQTLNIKNPKHFKFHINEDSQNHFCYMWSIMIYHYAIIHKNAFSGNVEMKLIEHPLCHIKRYCYNILQFIEPDLHNLLREAYKNLNDDDINYIYTFYSYFFRYIYTKLGDTYCPLAVIPCKQERLKNINDCLEISDSNEYYVDF